MPGTLNIMGNDVTGEVATFKIVFFLLSLQVKIKTTIRLEKGSEIKRKRCFGNFSFRNQFHDYIIDDGECPIDKNM